MAGPTRLELATSGVTGRRSNQLNYDPTSSKASNNSLFSDRSSSRFTRNNKIIQKIPHRGMKALLRAGE
jgi:hypothetical protein